MVVPCTHASGGTVSRPVSTPLKGCFEAIRQLLNEDTQPVRKTGFIKEDQSEYEAD